MQEVEVELPLNQKASIEVAEEEEHQSLEGVGGEGQEVVEVVGEGLHCPRVSKWKVALSKWKVAQEAEEEEDHSCWEEA